MQKKMDRLIFTTLMLFAFSNHAVSSNEEVVDLKTDWLVYSNQDQSYLPFIEELHEPNVIHFKLDLNKYRDYYLYLNLPSKISVLIENEIVFSYGTGNAKYYNIDSLKKKYGLDEILFSLFGKKVNPNEFETKIIDKNPSRSWSVGQSGFGFSRRTETANSDFFIISILMVLTVVIVVKQVLKNTFFEYFSIQKTFSIKPKSEGLFSIGIFSATNVLMMWLYGTALGFTIVMMMSVMSNTLQEWVEVHNSLELISVAIGVSLFLIVLMVVRYFLVFIISGIYKLRSFHLIQFYDYLRITLFITVLFFGLAIFNLTTNGYYLSTHRVPFLVFVVGVLSLRPMFIFLKLNKLSGYKNLHLFSYICGTEIIPLIVIAKIFLN